VPGFSALPTEAESIPVTGKMGIFLFGGGRFGASRHGTSWFRAAYMEVGWPDLCVISDSYSRGYRDGFVGAVSALVGAACRQVGAGTRRTLPKG
jgi:hypothetical protein